MPEVGSHVYMYTNFLFFFQFLSAHLCNVLFQPGTYPVAGQQNMPPPPDYFTRAIFVTLCCFWPTGILAIMKASDVSIQEQKSDSEFKIHYVFL